jgi:signal transduction histidine kinase
LHKLLARQLKRATERAGDGTPDLTVLFELVSRAYEEMDRERQLSSRAHRLLAEEREAAHALLRDAVTHVGVGFSIWDAEDRLLLFNEEFCAQWRDLGARLRPGLSFADFRAALVAGALDEGHLLPLGDGAETHVRHLQTVDGRIIRFRDAKTSDGCIVAVSTDISQDKRAELELRRAKEEAELASRAKSEFLANMSHELRTPLNAILGFSEIISSQLFGPLGNARYIEYAGNIHDSAGHLLEIISDILDMSKIEAGQLHLHEELFAIDRAATGCVALIAERAERGGVTVRNHIGATLPELRADQRMFKQILLNLLSNAVKFTPPGGAVMLEGRVDPAGRLILTVRDTGIGMSAVQMDQAMLPFRQVDSTMSRKYEGTGLGLPIVKALVGAHRGLLTLESDSGAGTTVTVTFPADRLPAGSPAEQQEASAVH